MDKPPAQVEAGFVPRCVGGRLAGPPKDCGGISGYMEYLDVLANPSHPEYAERKEPFGEIDPELFDLEAVNLDLARVFRKR